MKSIAILLSFSVLIILTSCNKCSNEDPTAKVVNNGSSAVNLQITSSAGNIISITELSKGSISTVNSYASGLTSIIGTIDGIELIDSIDMTECKSYDITITSNNEISVFSQEKN